MEPDTNNFDSSPTPSMTNAMMAVWDAMETMGAVPEGSEQLSLLAGSSEPGFNVRPPFLYYA